MHKQQLDLEELAGTLNGAMQELEPMEEEVALVLYRLLAEAEPVSLVPLAKRVDLSEQRVEEIVGRWPGVFRDGDGRVVGFWGLALPEMPHRLEVDGRRLHAWCAWDTLFLPELIGKPARVSSQCPVTGEPISLTVGPDGVEELSPTSTVVSMLAPTVAFDENVIANFCHFVHFFSSAEAGAQWTSRHEGTFLLSLYDAYTLGRLANHGRFNTALAD